MSLIRFYTPSHNNTGYSPIARLNAFQSEMDRLLAQAPHDREAMGLESWSPALDLYHDKDSLFVKVELPGMKKENVTLSFQDDVLTITGERRQEEMQPSKGSLRTERFFGRFERTVNMPTHVDGTRISATYENGVLTIILPKAEAAKPRQIEIGVK